MEGLDRLAVGSPHTLDLLVSSLFNHGYQMCLEVCEHIVILDFVGPAELTAMNTNAVEQTAFLQCRRFDPRLNQQLLEHLVVAHGMRIPPFFTDCIDALREAHEYELEAAILSSVLLLTARSVHAFTTEWRVKMNHLFKWTNSLLRPPHGESIQTIDKQQQSLYEQDQRLLSGDHDVFGVGYINLNFVTGTKTALSKALRSDSSEYFTFAHHLDELDLHANMQTSTSIDAVVELQTKIREHRPGLHLLSKLI